MVVVVVEAVVVAVASTPTSSGRFGFGFGVSGSGLGVRGSGLRVRGSGLGVRVGHLGSVTQRSDGLVSQCLSALVARRYRLFLHLSILASWLQHRTELCASTADCMPAVLLPRPSLSRVFLSSSCSVPRAVVVAATYERGVAGAVGRGSGCGRSERRTKATHGRTEKEKTRHLKFTPPRLRCGISGTSRVVRCC